MSRHVKKCAYKRDFNTSKTEILKALANQPIEPDRNEVVDISLIEMKNFLSDIFNRSRVLHRKIIENDMLDPIDKIKQMHVNDSTKQGYLIEFGLFRKWLKKNKKVLDVDSANQYLGQIKCLPSTLKKKQMILQNLLKVVVDPNIKLNPVRLKISFKPKYALSNEEILKYLEEQREDLELHLVQLLMIEYGLRISTPAVLRLEHLLFLDGESNLIILPDPKVKSHRQEEIRDELAQEFFKYLDGKDLKKHDYVFCRLGRNLSDARRAQMLGKIVNECIQKSKVIKKNPCYKYSSHMFRKTKANNLFQEGLKELKERSRKAIGQKSNSSAIEHYIDK
jgi:integrase